MLRSDAKRKPEQPRLDGSGRVVFVEVSKDAHEDIVGQVLDIAVVYAQSAQGGPHVRGICRKKLWKRRILEGRVGLVRREPSRVHDLGLAAARAFHHKK